ncbi:COAC decarboxylase, partial [Polypterus senegalus]
MEDGVRVRVGGPFHVLLGVTGSVAALKVPELVGRLLELPGVEVKVVTTDHAKHFFSPDALPVVVLSDSDEWEVRSFAGPCMLMWRQRSDPVLHIELRRWADLLLIAPLDANTLGKLASGICDNLLVRAPVAEHASCVCAS